MERPRLPDYETERSFEWQYVFELNRYIEYQERLLKISVLRELLDDEEAVLCGCIDKCSSKCKTYYCRRRGNCVHKM